MSFKVRNICGENVVLCFLQKYAESKAIPTSAYLEENFEINDCHCNYLNELDLPGRPAAYWISRGYDVYSLLNDNEYWVQICISNKKKEHKIQDLEEYRSEFIPENEPLMCDDPTCHAYMTFDECVHTLPDEKHYLVVDYL